MKISRNTKEKIAKNAANKYIDKRKTKHKRDSSRLALKCYKHVYSKKELDAVAMLPDGWVRKYKCLHFNVNGWNVTLTHENELPTKDFGYCKPLGSIEAGKLADEVQNHVQSGKVMVEDYSKFYHKVLSMLLSIPTWKRLQEAWPEGEEFYKELLPVTHNTAVPTVLLSEINANLKKAS